MAAGEPARTGRYGSGVRVILVSDTHLSPSAPEAEANWEAVLRHVEAAAPDLVVHLGDLTLDGAHDPGDLRYGRRQLDRLPVAWHAVPGNHDIGDNPWPGAPGDFVLDAGRQQRWLDVIGADHWALTLPDWTLLAVNAQLLGSGLEAEAGQWSWLAEQLTGRGENRRIALLTHKPVTAADPELAASPRYRFWPPASRDLLADLVRGRPLDLVLSGHAHQYRQLRLDHTDHLWVPTTWAVLPNQAQPVLGAKRCGIVSVELAAAPPQPRLVEPEGMAHLTLTRDLPDPYHR